MRVLAHVSQCERFIVKHVIEAAWAAVLVDGVLSEPDEHGDLNVFRLKYLKKFINQGKPDRAACALDDIVGDPVQVSHVVYVPNDDLDERAYLINAILVRHTGSIVCSRHYFF